jgi:hypothetical protein
MPMALKDLVAPKSALAEDAIEAMVKDYVRYDTDRHEIAFTPAAAALSNKAKVLLYLVALQGWSFVTDEAIAAEAKPGSIEEHIGIHGGTLRPLLKDLKDRHLIAVKAGKYSVRASSLAAIKREFDGAAAPPTRKMTKPKRASARAKESAGEQSAKAVGGKSANRGKPRKSSGNKGGNLSEQFNAWIDDGFFEQPRTIADVQKRFHQRAIIVPITSMPVYLLRAVRAGRLQRERQDVNGKQVWTYRKA